MEVAKMEPARFIYLILFLGTSYGERNDSSLCPTNENQEKCCSGYRKINKTCTECVGFIGENCMTPCPSNYYGVKCDSMCNCTEDEEYTRNNDTQTVLDFPIHHESCTLLLKLVLILGGSQILLLVFCFTVLLLKCCRLPPQHPKLKTENNEISSTTHQTEILTNHSTVENRSWNNTNTRSNSRVMSANNHHYDSVCLTEEEKWKLKTNPESIDQNTYFTLQPMR
ncbi:uncharacterized protein LOC133190044 isoform X2 [Saccostrea echinata]|uniref:uncharacterized protein LOC133190044 isoform X2 n=1 Tax=Saccostrea echinata TaxID=191078 RepID=UPI002A837ACF|nr:uncharacterized protein LOC133190044 isoform X2 [Saccostrea echinata]